MSVAGAAQRIGRRPAAASANRRARKRNARSGAFLRIGVPRPRAPRQFPAEAELPESPVDAVINALDNVLIDAVTGPPTEAVLDTTTALPAY